MVRSWTPVGIGILIIGVLATASLSILRSSDARKALPQGQTQIPSDDTALEWEEDEKDEISKTDPALPPTQTTSPAFLDILPEDCTDECNAFQDNTDRFAYCQSVCGFSPTVTDTGTSATPEDPSLKKVIEQKDAAIQASDLGQCAEIPDRNLRTACEVRVTEDLLE